MGLRLGVAEDQQPSSDPAGEGCGATEIRLDEAHGLRFVLSNGNDEGEHRTRKPMRLTVHSVSEEFDDRYCTRLANTQCYQVGSPPSSSAGSSYWGKTSFSGS